MRPAGPGISVFLALLLGPLVLGGCNGEGLAWFKPKPPSGQVPEPIDLLLPRTIRIQPFTGTRTFDEAGGIKGIDVRIEAKDAYGDSTKAFGDFRFELYEFRPNNQDPRGTQIATWEEHLLDPRKNALHWDNIHLGYEFKLQWDRPIPVGRKFILVAVFSSPFTERKFAQREFTAGQ
jgi:hypothetical protein